MKRIIKILAIIFIPVLIFYFWASSPSGKMDFKEGVESSGIMQAQMIKDSIAIMTFNLGYLSGMTNNRAIDRDEELYATNMERTKRLLQNRSIDIACFQEIDFNADRSFNIDQARTLYSSCLYRNYAWAVNWDKRYVPFPYWPPSNHFGSILSGQAVLSQFEILEVSHIDLKKADHPFYYNAFYLDRLAQVVRINIYGRELVLINVHMEAFDAKNREEQMEQLASLIDSYNEEPVVLLGDFNSTLPEAEFQYEKEETMNILRSLDYMKPALPDSLYLKNESEYLTFNSEEPSIRIDYIFYDSRYLQMDHARVLREAGSISDHLPIMAYLRFR